MKIKRIQRPNFKLQQAYDTLMGRIQGCGYRCDGDIQLDASGYGHGWIKVYRDDRKNNFIYLCSHSDNVDPFCCEPIYRYIKVYNYCDDPKDSNLLGELAYNVNPGTTDNIPPYGWEADEWHDNDYVYFMDNKSGIVYMYTKRVDDEGNVIPYAPYTTYPTNVQALSGELSERSDWPTLDIHDNALYDINNNATDLSALITNDDTLYVGQTSGYSDYLYWPSAMSGEVDSIPIEDGFEFTICPKCGGLGKVRSPKSGSIMDRTYAYIEPYSCSCQNNSALIKSMLPVDHAVVSTKTSQYDNSTRLDTNMFSCNEKRYFVAVPGKHHSERNQRYDFDEFYTEIMPRVWVEYVANNEYILHYALTSEDCTLPQYMSLCMIAHEAPPPFPVPGYIRPDYNLDKYDLITTRAINVILNDSEPTEITDTFEIGDLSTFIVKFTVPPVNGLVKVPKIDDNYDTGSHAENNIHISNETGSDNGAKFVYKKGYQNLDGSYINIPVIAADFNKNSHSYNKSTATQKAQILNCQLHAKTKTFEYSPVSQWDYDEIMNFILFKDENLPVLPVNNGIYYLKTNYWNDLSQPSEIKQLTNALEGNVCYHFGRLGDKNLRDFYHITFPSACDVPWVRAYNHIKYPNNFKENYNYLPNNNIYRGPFMAADSLGIDPKRQYTQNELFWETSKSGLFEGIYDYYNDIIDAIPDKYIWLDCKVNANENSAYEHYNEDGFANDYEYTGMIDTFEIQKPKEDKDWQWKERFHNYLTNRPAKSIYYKESFSSRGNMSAGSAIFPGSWDGSTNAGWYDMYWDNIKTWSLSETVNDQPNKANHYPIQVDVNEYRHLCDTCSGVGEINCFIKGGNWFNSYHRKGHVVNDTKTFRIPDKEEYIVATTDASYYADIGLSAFEPGWVNWKNNSNPKYEYETLYCPTCARTGVKIRYLYYNHKYVKHVGYSDIGLGPNDSATENVFVEPSLIMDEIKKDTILCYNDKEPIEYWYWSGYGWSIVNLGYKQIWKYETVKEKDNIGHPKVTNPKKDILYRYNNDVDDYVQYYSYNTSAMNPNGTHAGKEMWSRIYFDKQWIDEQYWNNHTFDNPNMYEVREEIVDRGEHNHIAMSQSVYQNLNDEKSDPYGDNDNELSLEYRKKDMQQSAYCPMCDGDKEVPCYDLDDNGNIRYDIANNPIMTTSACPVCLGKGYVEDYYTHDYNIDECHTCNGTGTVICTKCHATGYVDTNLPEPYQDFVIDYDHTMSEISEYISTNNKTTPPETPGDPLKTLFTVSPAPGAIQLFKIVKDIIRPNVYKYVAEPVDGIDFNCPICKDSGNPGHRSCPDCGGQNAALWKDHEAHRVAPGEEHQKKVYKYIIRKGITTDNISIEMLNE